MKFFRDKKTKALRITVDDSELTKRLVASENYEELTPKQAKSALGKSLDDQPEAVKTFIESDGEEAAAESAASPAAAPPPTGTGG